jgi:putative Mn2+ efflux pump MntP
MTTFELIITALALSMDAFAVAICKGLASARCSRVGAREMLIVGSWFGGFQGLMPLIGYLLASLFATYIVAFDHWVAFILLGFIGANMIRESFDKEDACDLRPNAFGFVTMLVMAIATSIDALAVGITYALLPDVNIWVAISAIGIITFALSSLGVKIGAIFGTKYKRVAELSGGIILVIMGVKILIEHLIGG